jgi:hypothetical protein
MDGLIEEKLIEPHLTMYVVQIRSFNNLTFLFFSILPLLSPSIFSFTTFCGKLITIPTHFVVRENIFANQKFKVCKPGSSVK